MSVSHRTADVETIERATAEQPGKRLNEIVSRSGVEEGFVLQTCNRVEWYIVVPSEQRGREVLSPLVDEVPSDAQQWLTHDEALAHLLRVSAGVESMVVGEDQILGQLKRACEDADRIGALGEFLEDIVWHAIRFGQEVRATTEINEGVNSLSRAGVELVSQHVDVQSSRALVVGAGEMGRLAAEALDDACVAELSIANRSLERANRVAGDLECHGNTIPLDEMGQFLPEIDVLMTATSSREPLITKTTMSSRDGVVIVDMGQPRDVDPTTDQLPGVEVFDLDDLEAITAATRESRMEAIEEVDDMLHEELDRLDGKLKRNQADEVIAAMYAEAETIKERELAEAMNRLEHIGSLDPEEQAVLEDFADALVGTIMAAPTKSLREAAEHDDWETIQAALRLFDPEFASLDDLPFDRIEASSVQAIEDES